MASCTEALVAGGSPARWRRALDRATAGVGVIDARLRGACELADVPTVLGDRELFGTTLAELTRSPAAAASPARPVGRLGARLSIGDEVSEQPQHGFRRLPKPQAPPDAPPHRRVRRTTTRRPLTAVTAPTGGAEDGSAHLIGIDRLRAIAGEIPGPFLRLRTPPPTSANPSRSTTHRPVWADPGLAGGAAFLATVKAAVSRRVGASASLPPIYEHRQVPRPGPTAPLELLRVVAFHQDRADDRSPKVPVDRTPNGSAPARATADDSGSTPRRSALTVPAPAPHTRRSDGGRSDPTAPLFPTVEQDSDPSGSTAPAMPQYTERPVFAVGDRTTGPASEHPPGPVLSAPRTSPATHPWSEADLERLMEQVLGDAARRHGIEV